MAQCFKNINTYSCPTPPQIRFHWLPRFQTLNIYIYISLSLSLSLSIYIYIYIYIYIMSLICDKSVTTQYLAFLSYWYRKKRLHMHF